MARKRMITRTVEQTTAEVMTLDITTAEVRINSYTIGGSYTDTELLAQLKKLFESDTLKLVHIETQHREELLLGMPEEDFIRLAQVLPPRTTHSKED